MPAGRWCTSTRRVARTPARLAAGHQFQPAADDISVRWARPVPEHFHARYSALARIYRYLILNRAARSALAAARVRLGATAAGRARRCRRRPIAWSASTTSAPSAPPNARRARRCGASTALRGRARRRLGLDRRRRQRLPAPHGAQHRRPADRTSARARPRRPGRARCSSRATARRGGHDRAAATACTCGHVATRRPSACRTIRRPARSAMAAADPL